ncbi:MAG: DUF3332 domain-containing protein [Bacteroides sp.]|nr:DUF3332 domain-containing protein [Bacteroides sp.]
MRKNKMTLVCAVLAGSMLFTSCIGSFKLWNNLKDWNQDVSNSKFVNELLFIALHIVPVYEIAYLADALVLNSIEFWSGSNPVASNETKEVKGENGDYLVTTTENGYTITHKGDNQSMNLVYNEETKTWNAVTSTENIELLRMNENGTVSINMQNGTSMTVMPDMQGVAAARAAIGSTLFYAAR